MKIIKLDGKCDECGEIDYLLCGRCQSGKMYRYIIREDNITTTEVRCMLCFEHAHVGNQYITGCQCPHCKGHFYVEPSKEE